jgi:chemotaxis receptor (MCP) glutamine deamidase CheD
MTGALVPNLGSPPHCGAAQHLSVRASQPESPSLNGNARRKPGVPLAKRITLYIGEVAASQTSVVLDTLLGSCVAVCLYDPVSRIGGMNHILLPNCRVGEVTPRCGVHAMELLINEIMKLGGDRRRLIAKAFGGATVIAGTRLPPIGAENARFVRKFLADENIPLIAERMGGDHPVHVYFHTDTGKATVHTVDGSSLSTMVRAERCFGETILPNQSFGGEIVLF